MKKSMMFVVTLVIAGLLMVSCGAPAGTATGADAPGDKTTAAGGEDELNILCFQGYAEDGWLKPFEEKYGCKVNATYAGTVEEMFTKAMAGGAEYDLISIDCGSLQRYYDQGLIQEIDQGKITNYDKLSQFFKDADYKMIDGKMYHVPMCWGSNNIVYNKAEMAELPQSWSVLWDPQYKDQVSITDEGNNNIVVVSMALGFEDPFNLTDEQFAQVKEKLTEIAKNCRTFTNGIDNEFQLLSTGETNASISSYDSGLILKLRDEAQMDVGRMMPEEGIYVWIDGWAMLKDAAHPDLAEKWMDWMLSDENQQALAGAVSYGAVTPSAKDALDPDVVSMCSYDNIDNIRVPVFILKTPEDFEKRTELWNEIKAEIQ